jgi:hypothetical protein
MRPSVDNSGKGLSFGYNGALPVPLVQMTIRIGGKWLESKQFDGPPCMGGMPSSDQKMPVPVSYRDSSLAAPNGRADLSFSGLFLLIVVALVAF